MRWLHESVLICRFLARLLVNFWAAGVGGSNSLARAWPEGALQQQKKKKSVSMQNKIQTIQIICIVEVEGSWCQCGISMLTMRPSKQWVQSSNSKQGHTVASMQSTWSQTQTGTYRSRATVQLHRYRPKKNTNKLEMWVQIVISLVMNIWIMTEKCIPKSP